MATSRVFGFNPNRYNVEGTNSYSNVLVASGDTIGSDTGVTWYMGPDEELGYIICDTRPGIVQKGIVLNLDASNDYSYPGSGLTWSDLSGNGYNATIPNDGVYYSNESFLLNSGVTISNCPLLYPGISDFTLSIWMTLTGFTGQMRVLWRGDAIGGSHGFGISTTSSDNRFYIEVYGTTGGRQFMTTSYYFTSYIGTFHYWNFIIDQLAFQVRTYVDGNYLNTIQYNNWGSINQDIATIFIGTYNNTNGWDFDNKISSILVHNRALTSGEILQNFNATKYKFGFDNIVTDGLVLNLDASSINSFPTYPTTGTTWYDLSGKGNRGTLISGVTYSGVSYGCLSFDGSNDYCSVGNLSNVINFVTVTCFVKRGVSSTWGGSLFGFGTTAGDTQDVYFWGSQSGKFFGFNTWNTDSWGFTGSTTNGEIMDGNWHHLTAIFNRNSITGSTIYIDGILKNSTQVYGTTLTRTISSNFGISLNGWNVGNQLFNGFLSNIQVYNRSLTQDEITQNYNTSKYRFGL